MQRVLYGNTHVSTHSCRHNSKAKLITVMHRTKSHNQKWNTSNDSKKKNNHDQITYDETFLHYRFFFCFFFLVKFNLPVRSNQTRKARSSRGFPLQEQLL